MNNLDLRHATKCIFRYSADSQLTVLGQFVINIGTDLKSVQFVIHAIQGHHESLFSYDTAYNLGLVHGRVKHVNDCLQVCDMLVQMHPTLFDDIGKLRNAEVTLHIDTSITPVAVAQATRRIRYHMGQEVEK